jgi:CHAD domain-containing protein
MLDIHLDPHESAYFSIRKILLYLLDDLENYEQDTKTDNEVENVHQFRVTVRRTRSALTQFKDIFPDNEIAFFYSEFSWLGEVTGSIRDLDVHLLKFDSYLDKLPKDTRTDLELMKGFLKSQRDIEYVRLIEELESARYKKLKEKWRNYLKLNTGNVTNDPELVILYQDYVRKKLKSLYKHILKEGDRITVSSPAEKLHDLRKSCKKFRYLIEFSRNLFQRDQVKSFIKLLKLMQDSLGDYQDLEVQVESMKNITGQMYDAGYSNYKTFIAIGMLNEILMQDKKNARSDSLKKFKKFSNPGRRKEFYSMIKK